MFGGLSSWLDSATEALQGISQQGAELVRSTGLLDLDERYNDPETAPVSVSAPADDSAGNGAAFVTVALVTKPSDAWLDAPSEWDFLIMAALSDANTCAIDPLQLEESEREAFVGAIRAALGEGVPVPPVDCVYQPSEEMLTWMPTQIELMKAYTAAVPAFVSEERFWNTLGWKLDVFRLCSRADVLLAVCRACAAPLAHADGPAPDRPPDTTAEAEFVASTTETRATDHGGSDADADDRRGGDAPNSTAKEAEYWLRIEAQWEQIRAREAEAAEHTTAATAELEAADGNLKLLTNLLTKKDVSSALAQSVIESCEYHKIKLTRLLARVVDEQDTLSGSSLDMHDGPVYARLLRTNHNLQLALAQADAVARGEDVPDAPVPCTVAPDSVAVASTPTSTEPQTGAAAAATPRRSPADVLVSEAPVATTMSPASSVSAAQPVRDASVEHEDVRTDVPSAEKVTGTSPSALDDTSFEAVLPWDDGE